MARTKTTPQFTTDQLIQRLAVVEVLDVEDLAILIKRTPNRIRHMVAAREIPHYKSETGKVTFLKSEIQQWQLGQRVATSSEIDSLAATYIARNPR